MQIPENLQTLFKQKREKDFRGEENWEKEPSVRVEMEVEPGIRVEMEPNRAK